MSGPPVAEREPATAQLLEPVASTVSPIVSRTLAICSARPSPSPSQATPGVSDDRIAPRIAGIQARCQLRAQLARHLGAQELALPVGRQPEREELGEGQRVGRRERLERSRRSWSSTGSGRSRGGRVDAGAERLELGAQPRLERLGLALGGASQPQGAHEAVRLQPRLGRRSRTAGRSRCAGRGRAARGGPGRGRSPRRTTGRACESGADVRNPPAVAPDLDRSLEPVEPQPARGARQRAAEELPPQARGGRRRQRRERRRRGARDASPACRRAWRQL